MNCVLPSLNVPIAEYCNDEPGATNALLGVNEIEVSVAELTVREAVPLALAPP